MGLASAAAHAHYVNGMVSARGDHPAHPHGVARRNDSDDRDDQTERERGILISTISLFHYLTCELLNYLTISLLNFFMFELFHYSIT